MGPVDARTWRKYLAFGSGVGIEAGRNRLHIVVVQARPAGVFVPGTLALEHYRDRPAAEWGAEYTQFLQRLGCGHLAATVLLPRRDVIVRQVSLPGVAAKDLPAALTFQVENLHPYAEDQALFAWLHPADAAFVVVGITQRDTVGHYIEMFSEAGIRVASVTFSAAALYAGLRFPGAAARANFLVSAGGGEAVELYGESDERGIFSASVQEPIESVAALAAADLRLAEGTPLENAGALLPPVRNMPEGVDPQEYALPYAAALVGACRWLSPQANLLPPELRASSARWIYVPTAALAAVLLLLAIVHVVQWRTADRRIIARLNAEAARLAPQVKQAAALDRSVETTLAHIRDIDSFRGRTRADLDVMAELTRLLEPPGYATQLEITRDAVSFAGEAPEATGLLKTLDAAAAFRASEFSQAIARGTEGASFRIRTLREGAPQ